MIACRHENKQHVGTLVLSALEERREVGNGAGAARRDGVDHFAAVMLEGVLESVQRVFAGRIVAIGTTAVLACSLVAATSPMT